MLKLLIIAVLFATTLTVGQAFAGDPAAGKAKFDSLCVSCHGTSGKGDGPAAVALTPKPANLIASALSDADMTKIIKEGGPAVGKAAMMAPFGASLSDADIANVVAYIRTLK